MSIITGYQVYISRAEATGKLDGWEVEAVKEAGKLIGARATIYRKDWGKPFVWETSLAEFNRNNGNWRTMPEFMIKKVCLCQGFRLCFPNEFSGMPYIAEELPTEPVIDVKPIEPEPQGTSAEILIARLQSCKTVDELRQAWESIQTELKTLDAVNQELVKTTKDRLKTELSHKEIEL